MSILEIIELTVLICCVLGLLIYILIKGIKNKWFKQIYDTLTQSMKEAEEKFKDPKQGEQKKKYVLDKVIKKCEELGIPYLLIKTLISKIIDDIVKKYNIFTK